MGATSVLEVKASSMAKVVAERQKLIDDAKEIHTHDHTHHLDYDGAPQIPSFDEQRKKAMETNKKAMRKLTLVLFTSFIFIIIEIVGGYYANSIAIMSDAAHIASDVIGFGISICALKIAHRNADSTYTFGYHRVEIIGAFCSIFTIWIMTVWLLYEATKRFWGTEDIGGTLMLSVAGASFVFNLIQIKILHSGEGGHVHIGG